MRRYSFLLIVAGFILNNSFAQLSENKVVDSLVNELWVNTKGYKSSRIIKKIEKQNPQFDYLTCVIKNQIKFPGNVKKGFVEWEYEIDSIKHYCIVIIPNNYDPAKKYAVTVFLHGAIMNLNPRYVSTFITPTSYNPDSLDRIIIYPASWMQSLWWSNRQVENLKYIIERLKKNYNVDENNIHLSGYSDGATGSFYQANMNGTPWATIRSYIGNPNGVADLSNQNIFLKNFNSVPWLIVNTTNDKLFPASEITPFIQRMRMAGNTAYYYIMEGYGHDLNWVPLLKDSIRNFLSQNIRNPYSPEIYWRTENTIKYGRNRWVIIDKLKKNTNTSACNDITEILVPYNRESINLSGFIHVTTNGNIINVTTENVEQYTLLISPEQFNFNKPITVYTNENLSFEGEIEKNIHTLLKWVSRDLDRTMLFGYELKIRL